MKFPGHQHGRREPPGVTMTPMIDVVFLLLIFFVWTASFQIVERFLPSGILSAPGTGAASQLDPAVVDFDIVVVRIGWQASAPAWSVNGTPQDSLSQLQTTLDAVANVKSDIPVVVDPRPEVPLGHVIDVYDITRQVGFAKIQFAAAPAS